MLVRSRTHHRRGTTLVEVAFSTLILGFAMVAALRTLGVSAQAQKATLDRARASLLAEHILSEVFSTHYAEPRLGLGSPIGANLAELAVGRKSAFNDVDDFHGWQATPPRNPDGTPIEGAEGLTERIFVHWVARADLGTPVGFDTGIKRVTVRIQRGRIILAEAVGYRTFAADEVKP